MRASRLQAFRLIAIAFHTLKTACAD
jgi:hypothetical protein